MNSVPSLGKPIENRSFNAVYNFIKIHLQHFDLFEAKRNV